MPKEKHKGESPFDPPRTIIACFGCAQKKQRIAPQTVGTAAKTFSCSLPSVKSSPCMTPDFPTHAGKKTLLCADVLFLYLLRLGSWVHWPAGFRGGTMLKCGPPYEKGGFQRGKIRTCPAGAVRLCPLWCVLLELFCHKTEKRTP